MAILKSIIKRNTDHLNTLTIIIELFIDKNKLLISNPLISASSLNVEDIFNCVKAQT